MINCEDPPPPLHRKLHQDKGAGPVSSLPGRMVVWPQINVQPNCVECLNEYMNLNSIYFCSPRGRPCVAEIEVRS